MNRQEHLEWCKQRAYEYLDRGDVVNAWTSMCSDLGKHDETEDHPGIDLGMMMLLTDTGLRTAEETRKFIEGFN